VWLMRQAGRYLPEYLNVRAKAGSFLGLCYNPELACEVTLQPLRRFDLDAAILFSDILVVPHAMGLGLQFVENEGPRLETVAGMAGVQQLKPAVMQPQYKDVVETVRRVKAELAPEIGFIGFCGAPWTVASYMIEGGSSRREKARLAAVEGAPWFAELIDRLVEHSIFYLCEQINAGVDVVQIFDSWAGDLPELQQKRWADAPIARIVSGVRARFPGFPVIVFARGVGARHGEIARFTHANAVSVEQDMDLREVLDSLPDNVAVQGNLDPELLLGAGERLVARVGEIVCSVPKERHIFNLGHGIHQKTDPAAVTMLVEALRRFDSGSA
jgi:uroporphyrinogen decarboxylase